MFRGKMVATRRSTCLNSSQKKDESELITQEATPTTRITRRRSVITKSQSEHTPYSQQKNAEKQSKVLPAAASPLKREAKSSKCPTDSTHEADVSDSESCCSVASGILDVPDIKRTPRTSRRRVARETPLPAVQQEASEEETRSSALVSKPSRSTRSQKIPPSAESTTPQDSLQSEAESCSSVASLTTVIETRMITRSRRKTAAIPSEADSCSSAISSPQGSTVRKSAYNRRVRPMMPIPIHLEQDGTTDGSVSSGSSRTIRHRSKASAADENEPYDSDGYQSGPSTSPWRTTRGRASVVDSDFASSSVDSPRSLRVKLTPCSSQTDSSNRAVSTSRTRNKIRVHSNVLDVASEREEMESKKSVEEESKKSGGDQADTSLDVPCVQSVSPAVSSMEEVEDIEDEEADKTVISADQECLISEDTKLDSTVTFDEDDAVDGSAGSEKDEPESRQETYSTEENHSTKEREKNENCTGVIEECEVVANEAGFAQRSQSETETVTMLNEPEETVEVVEDKAELMAGAVASKVDQAPSELAENSAGIGEETAEVLDDHVAQKAPASYTVTHSDRQHQKVECEKQDIEVEQQMGTMDTTADTVSHASEDWNKEEDMDLTQIEEEGPSCSSNTQKLQMTMKGGPSLLDSEDESDEEVLSEEAVEHTHSEDEVVSPDDSQPGPSWETHNSVFVIDKRPGLQPCEKYYIDAPHEKDDHDFKAGGGDYEEEEEFVDDEGDDDDDDDDEDSKLLYTVRKPQKKKLSSSIDPGLKVKELGGLYISFDGTKSKSVSNNLKNLKDQKNQDQLLKKSVIVADFEKKDAVPPYKESKHAAKLKRKEERAKTTGEGWFNMRAPELTEDLRNDLKALQMRSAMDPKRFYKKNDREGFPKYFQVGTVVDSPVDFYHSRVPKKQRKRTIMEELLADAEFRSFNKRKYQEIMAEKAAEAAGRMNKKKHKMNKKK